jgi:hypothetical protein
MGFLDRLLGRPERPAAPQGYRQYEQGYPQYEQGYRPAPPSSGGGDADERAISRYRYLLRTAPPETIEQAHAEAFAQLTPDQRRQVLSELGRDLPASERSSQDDPRSLARMATRAEMRQPGTLERALGGSRMGGFGGGGMGGIGGIGGGMGMGGMIAGTLLASIAGTVIGSGIASAFFDENDPGDAGNSDAGDSGSGDSGSGDSAESADAADAAGGEGSVETVGDVGGGGYGGDYGGGYGGGGDFGGGDFGGGDF